MALPTATEIRALIENYGVTTTVLSDAWFDATRNNFVIPWIEDKIRKPVTQIAEIEEYHDGNGERVLVLRRRPIIALVSISYTDLPPDQAPLSVTAVTVLAEEGMLKAKAVEGGAYSAIFVRGSRNIRVRYQVGYTEATAKIKDAIKCLVAEQALGQIADQTGGGNLNVQSFGRQWGNRGKYTNIRNQLARRGLALLRSEMTGVGG